MIVRVCAVLLLALFVVPFGMGEAFINARDKRLVYFGGLFASLTVFEILMLIFHAAMGSLRVMTALWCLLCGAVAVYGWCKYGRSAGKNGLASVRASLKDWTRTEKLLLAFCLGLVVLQIANTVFNVTYKNWDDETYCANAVGAVYTDLVNRVAPESGVLHPAFYNKKYVIAGWPIYSSMLSVLSGIHAAIIYRTILPIFEMALAYYLLYSLLRHFLRDDRRKALIAFVFVYQFFLLAAKNMSQFSNEWWLLVNGWTGAVADSDDGRYRPGGAKKLLAGVVCGRLWCLPDCCIAVYDAAGAVCSLGPVLLPAAQRLGPVVEICAVCSPGGGLCADHTALRTAAYEQPEKVSAFCVHCRPAASCGSSLPAGRGDMEPVGKPYLSAHLFYQDR